MDENMDEFEKELFETITQALMLGPSPAGFHAKSNLFEELGLDSVDALEIVMAIKRKYRVQFRKEDEEKREIFHTLQSLSNYVQERLAEEKSA